MKKTNSKPKARVVDVEVEPVSIPPVTNELVIVEKCNRGALNEGRSSGMAFAYLKRISDNEYHTVIPMSPCKDYLCEVVVTEHTGIPSSGCGLKYTAKEGIFNDPTFLGIKMMRTKSGGYNYVKSIEEETKMLKESHKNMEKLLNFIEEQLGIETKTVITEAKDDYFLVSSSPKWHISTISSSLYTLLIRCAIPYKGDIEPMQFLKTYNYHGKDAGYLKASMPRLELCIKEKKLPPNRFKFPNYNGFLSPHGRGILSWDSKFEEVKIV